jgi:hypothetical protein
MRARPENNPSIAISLGKEMFKKLPRKEKTRQVLGFPSPSGGGGIATAAASPESQAYSAIAMPACQVRQAGGRSLRDHCSRLPLGGSFAAAPGRPTVAHFVITVPAFPSAAASPPHPAGRRSLTS